MRILISILALLIACPTMASDQQEDLRRAKAVRVQKDENGAIIDQAAAQELLRIAQENGEIQLRVYLYRPKDMTSRAELRKQAPDFYQIEDEIVQGLPDNQVTMYLPAGLYPVFTIRVKPCALQMLLNHPAVLEVHRGSVGIIEEDNSQTINDAVGLKE